MRSTMQQSHAAATANLVQRKLEQILDPAHPLCKDDVVWVLEYIKKKVAEKDPQLMELPQPRLMQNFRYFADISLMLIHRRYGFDQEAGRLKAWIAEAVYGIRPQLSDKPQDHKPAD